MPKVSKATASSHQPIPGVLDAYSHEIDGWTISMETHLNDLDAAFLFKGAPNDQCQAPHMGYVLKGKYGMRIADGVEEVFEAGDAFFIGPGHTPIIFAGCEIVYFTRTEDANRELPVAMANLMKYMEEQGMEVPATPQPSPQRDRRQHSPEQQAVTGGARLLHDEAYLPADVALYGVTTGRYERNT